MNNKLEKLAKIEAYEVDDLLESAVMDGTCAGICSNPDCEYTASVEPDQSRGWCERCGTKTVQSCLILAGII